MTGPLAGAAARCNPRTLLGLLLLALAACHGDSGGAGTSASRSNVNRADALLDAGSYDAARGIIENAVSSEPENARAHIVYLRWLLLSSDLAEPGFLASPYERSGEKLTVSGLAEQAAKTAAALDPDRREEITDVIYESLEVAARGALERGRGLIGTSLLLKDTRTGQDSLSTGFATSMLQTAWTGLDLAPAAARQHRQSILQLMELAIRKGKVTSAAMLGNLLGDLEQDDRDGGRDLERACEGFERALANYTTDSGDWIAYTLEVFDAGIFEPELARARAGDAPSACRKLESALDTRGYSLLKVAAAS